MQCAFYPGAGTDLTPPVLFPHIKTWWYMDGQPGNLGIPGRLEHPQFLAQLDTIMSQCAFKLLSADCCVRRYYSESTDQTIHYETNTRFPEAWDPQKHSNNIGNNTLVLCGFDIYDDGRRDVPLGFFSFYSHIITNSETIWEAPTTTSVSSIQYPRADDYWKTEHKTKERILARYSVLSLPSLSLPSLLPSLLPSSSSKKP